MPTQGGQVLILPLSPSTEERLAKPPVRALEKSRCQLSLRWAPGCEAHRRPTGLGHSGGEVGARAVLLGCHLGRPQLCGMPFTSKNGCTTPLYIIQPPGVTAHITIPTGEQGTCPARMIP